MLLLALHVAADVRVDGVVGVIDRAHQLKSEVSVRGVGLAPIKTEDGESDENLLAFSTKLK